MQELRGRTVLVTGASGGLGRGIALRLAREGMDVVVSGRRKDALAAVVTEIQATGARAQALPADLSDLRQVDVLAERGALPFGPIDLLVNNAGVEAVCAFDQQLPEALTSMVDVNLTAPLLLTHRLLPGMLERGRGHVVFISSIAGKIGPAYNEPYAATKAGLIGLTQSLRAEYVEAPVGFSVVCPGFIAGDGMYQRMADDGHRSNRLMGTTTVERVAERTITAIRKDLPEVIESGAPIRPALALAVFAPRLMERIAPRFGITALFRRVAESRSSAG